MLLSFFNRFGLLTFWSRGFALMVLLLGVSGCSVSADDIQMELSLSPSTLVMGPESNYKGDLSFHYKVVNTSGYALRTPEYEFSLLLRRPGEGSATLISMLPLSVDPGASYEGDFHHRFDYVLGEDGDHEVVFQVAEVIGENSYIPIRETFVPIVIVYE